MIIIYLGILQRTVLRKKKPIAAKIATNSSHRKKPKLQGFIVNSML